MGKIGLLACEEVRANMHIKVGLWGCRGQGMWRQEEAEHFHVSSGVRVKIISGMAPDVIALWF